MRQYSAATIKVSIAQCLCFFMYHDLSAFQKPVTLLLL